MLGATIAILNAQGKKTNSKKAEKEDWVRTAFEQLNQPWDVKHQTHCKRRRGNPLFAAKHSSNSETQWALSQGISLARKVLIFAHPQERPC